MALSSHFNLARISLPQLLALEAFNSSSRRSIWISSSDSGRDANTCSIWGSNVSFAHAEVSSSKAKPFVLPPRFTSTETLRILCVSIVQSSSFPSLQRRGGRAIKKMVPFQRGADGGGRSHTPPQRCIRKRIL